MASEIQTLPNKIIDLIAAGEVIDSIAAVIRELIENSLDAGATRIAVALNPESWQVQVSDNGKGMPQKQLNQIFDPFFTTKREQGGSGLGTHIIYNLVRQTLDGDIEATSELGKGLTYRITFPKKNSFAQQDFE